ncbi:hypothetical protein OIDMADRAFT_20736 [Oidiodendron maius Zn]|uniref:Uncharacterized protein n=1 Tax=Oidiodendron maius (strain Zn) TaxID=913774 RepID=A0A0C3D303_OIDMZ|nr:hypothetical protein OIDMADRAFT_20736 [Oidiodendron maius Zn]
MAEGRPRAPTTFYFLNLSFSDLTFSYVPTSIMNEEPILVTNGGPTKIKVRRGIPYIYERHSDVDGHYSFSLNDFYEVSRLVRNE